MEASAAQPALAISQYWDTEAIPPYIGDQFATFRELNPEFRHRIFSESAAEALIGERFGERQLSAFRACAIPSMQSDYFRYCAVLAFGGVYADADARCMRPLRPLLEQLDGGEIFFSPTAHMHEGREARRIWSHFFAFRQPGHPFVKLALEIATANLEERIAERVWLGGDHVVNSVWLTVGPGVFSLMRFIWEWGSFDAFIATARGTPVEHFAPLYCEVIGDYERLTSAFEGVRTSSYEEMQHWVEEVPRSQLPYKETDDHWHNARGSIFR